jgi:hypothetical protein
MGRKQAQALLAALISSTALAQQYEPTLIQPQLLGSPQGMTALNLGDDNTQSVNLGFTFGYYGQSFTSAWVSSNGFVSFQGPDSLCCNGYPMAQAQRNTIYAYWTDLISTGNPYYRTDGSSALFGWYDTREYGTNNKNTFEIGLSADGSIQINYGMLGNTYHLVSAGITGPTEADNIQLFYGQNVQNLQNQSGLLSVPPPPEPEPVVVPPAAIDPAPDVAPDPTQEVVVQNEPEQVQEEVVVEEPVAEDTTEAAQETVSEEVIVSDDLPVEQDENQAEDANDTPLSPDQLQALSAVEQTDAPTDEEVSQATEAVAQEAQAAEAARIEQQGSPDQTAAVSTEMRRDRNVDFFQREAIEDADTFARETVLQASAQNIAMLMQADAQDAQTYGEQTTTEVTGEGYYFGIVDGPTFLPPPTTGMVERVEETSVEQALVETAPVQEVVSAPQATEQTPVASLTPSVGVDVTPAGQAQQMEILNMAGLQGEMSAGPVVDVGDVNTGDGEAMAQLAVIPAGYSSYTQARIPDAPFYQPRDIYKNRRIPDANMALYRMMQGQDRVWNDMVEDQYE